MPRDMRARLLGSCGLIMGIGLIVANASQAADDTEVPKDVKEAILKIAAAEEAGKKDDAKKEAETLAKKKGYDGSKPGSCDSLMHIFAPRKKGGFGFGEKAKGTQDGIELKIQALGSKKLSPLVYKKEAADIKNMAYITLAVADVTLAAAPKKDAGKKKAKDWIKWTQEMREAAAGLAKATDPQKIQTISKNLDGSCSSCHEVFRQQ